MNNWPKISVIVPIKNEAKFIAATIGQIQAQEYPFDKMEILVAAGQCDDNSVEIVKGIASHDPRVKLLHNPVGRSSGGRNIGVRNSTGEIITFIDGHTFIDNNQLLKNTAALMLEKKVSVLSRPQFLEPPDNDFFQKAVALARRSLIGHGLDSTIYSDKDAYVKPDSSGASYKRDIFDRVGYFDERFDACEDVEFNHRVGKAGFQSFTSMKLVVYYYPRETLKGLLAQMKRYGIGRFRLGQKHRAAMNPGTLVPPLFILLLAGLALFSIFQHYFIYPLALLIALYLLAILTGAIWVSLRKGIQYLGPLLLIYPVIHFGLGWGFLTEGWRWLAGRGIDLGTDLNPK